MTQTPALTRALQLARDGVAVYPLASGTKTPLKGSRGYLDATTDVATLAGWFEHVPRANLGIRLDQSGLVVIDVDRHTDQHGIVVADGIQTIRQLHEQGKTLPPDTYIERTPHGGLHYFFKTPIPISKRRQINLYPGVDVLADFVLIAPSIVDGATYQAINEVNSIAVLPDWLLEGLLPGQYRQPTTKHVAIRKTWAGRMLDDLISGTTEGNRNSYLTSLLGKLLKTGCQSATAYELLQVANERLQPPLPDKEVNQIFKSIIKRV
ncbi:bifunctional DNA primase/polymerase [Lactiplantibacillus pentosus]|uniref:bifunctional DNA primase/polymerase n=1 Tax=Lactiplantibacillus pentosus TaxID=1589 RepID=UPI0031E742C1